MRVSQTAEYALRAMAALATVSSKTPIRAVDLSRATTIPSHYLAKVLRRLVLAGLLTSQKGQGGGFTLARPAQDITFLEILEAVDAFPAEGRCAFGWPVCDAANPCPLHDIWSRLNVQQREWATTATLAEVAEYANTHDHILPPSVTE